MAEVKWIKIVTDVFDDEKVLMIETMPEADTIIVIWFKLLCLAGKINNGGVLFLNSRVCYTDEMLAAVFRRPINIVRLALRTFEEFGMIELLDGVIAIPNWEKHQSKEGLDRIQEKNRERQKKFKTKQKLLAANPESNVIGNVTGNVIGNVTVTDSSYSYSLSLEDIEDKRGCGGERKEKKQAYGQYGWVKLTETERQRLIDEYGEAIAEHYIAYVDESAQSTGNKNKWKDWNLVIRRAIKNKWGGGPAEQERGYKYFD